MDAHGVGEFDDPSDLGRIGSDLNRDLGRADPVPPLLPYLCDRTEPTMELSELLEASVPADPDTTFFEQGIEAASVVVALVRGVRDQAPDKFIETLHHELWRKLPRFSGHDGPVQRYAPQWPRGRPGKGAGSFERRLLGCVNAELNGDLSGGKKAGKAVLEALSAHPGPVLVSIQVPTSQWPRGRTAELETLIRFWLELELEERACPILVVPVLKPPRKMRWLLRRRINAALDDIAATFHDTGAVRVLDALDNVGALDADQWSLREDVKEIARGKSIAAEIGELFDDDGLPMSEAAEGLRTILAAAHRERSTG